MAQLQTTTIDDTGFLRLPAGTSAQRPASPTAGMIRYNTTFDLAEVYNGTFWSDPGTGLPITEIGNHKSFPAKSAKHLQRVIGNTRGWYYIDVFKDGNPRLIYVNNIFDGGGYYLVLQNRQNYGGMTFLRYSEATGGNQTFRSNQSFQPTAGSAISDFTLWTGMRMWQALTRGTEQSGNGGRVAIFSANSPVDLDATGSHLKRSIATYTGFNQASGFEWQFQGTSQVSNTSDAPGFISFAMTNGRGLTTTDRDIDTHPDNCSNFYDGQPYWYTACWSGNPWGFSANDGPYWTSSDSGNRVPYYAIYLR
jgi:hypothetical protein